jgi:hypothetical protein
MRREPPKTPKVAEGEGKSGTWSNAYKAGRPNEKKPSAT